MEISNIKCHITIQKKDLTQLYNYSQKKNNLITSYRPSFFVMRIGSYVFICFYKGFINITGVKNENLIPIVINKFCIETNISTLISPYVIDNISATYKFKSIKPVNLSKLLISIKEDPRVISVKFCREKFPGAFIKTKNGTIIWFSSNKVTSVGGKNKTDLNILYEIITSYWECENSKKYFI